MFWKPEGTVEIKFRRKDLEKTMQRLDKACIQIVEKLSSPQLNPDEKGRAPEKTGSSPRKVTPYVPPGGNPVCRLLIP